MKLHTNPNYKAKKSIYLMVFLTFLYPTISSAEESFTTEANEIQLTNLETLKSTGNCSNCDLRNINLEKFKLKNANLSNSDFSGAKLNGADLRGANLSHAKNLSLDALKDSLYNEQTQFPLGIQPDPQLMYKIVPGTVLPLNAKLNGVDLSGENLRSSVMVQADLQNAKLIGTDLSGAVLNGAKLCKAKMLNANLRGASLSFANLTGADLTYARLSPRNGLPTKLNGAFLANTILNDADLEKAYLARAEFKGTLLRRANLSGADFHEAILYKVDLSGLSGAELYDVSLIGQIGANLEGSNLNKAEVTNSDLRGTNLLKTNVNLASLEKQLNWLNGAIGPDGNIATTNEPQVFINKDAGSYGKEDEIREIIKSQIKEDTELIANMFITQERIKKMISEDEKKVNNCKTGTNFEKNPQFAK
jgi:uncharacterized protein YjbI with pentapeptide repeats